MHNKELSLILQSRLKTNRNAFDIKLYVNKAICSHAINPTNFYV